MAPTFIGRTLMASMLLALGGLAPLSAHATTAAKVEALPPTLSLPTTPGLPQNSTYRNPRALRHSPYQRRFVKGKLSRFHFEALRMYAGRPYVNGAENLYRPAQMNRAARRAAAMG